MRPIRGANIRLGLKGLGVYPGVIIESLMGEEALRRRHQAFLPNDFDVVVARTWNRQPFTLVLTFTPSLPSVSSIFHSDAAKSRCIVFIHTARVKSTS